MRSSIAEYAEKESRVRVMFSSPPLFSSLPYFFFHLILPWTGSFNSIPSHVILSYTNIANAPPTSAYPTPIKFLFATAAPVCSPGLPCVPLGA
jgi:hypothetical protein